MVHTGLTPPMWVKVSRASLNDWKVWPPVALSPQGSRGAWTECNTRRMVCNFTEALPPIYLCCQQGGLRDLLNTLLAGKEAQAMEFL